MSFETLAHPLVLAAEAFAEEAHSSIGQMYGDLPYSHHTMAVARRVARYVDDVEVVAAAHLHDTIEDTWATRQMLVARFGRRTACIVVELKTPKEKTPRPRAERAKAEVARLADVSAEAKGIKCADVTENMGSIVARNPNFARIYIPEKRALLPALFGAHPALLQEAIEAVASAERALAALPPKVQRRP